MGHQVTIVEKLPLLGGSLNFQRFDVEGEYGEALANTLAAEMAEVDDRITVLLGATCREITANRHLKIEMGDAYLTLTAERIVIATGATERFSIFPNNDLPGIMPASTVSQLLWLYGVRPGRRAVVVADSGDGFGLALDLLDAGIAVQAVLDPRKSVQSDPRRDAVAVRGVEIGYGYGIRAAFASDAERHLAGVTMEYLHSPSQARPKPVELDCDLLCLASHTVPNFDLAIRTGANLRYSPAASAMTLVDIPEGIHLAGSVCGCWSVDEAIESGREAVPP